MWGWIIFVYMVKKIYFKVIFVDHQTPQLSGMPYANILESISRLGLNVVLMGDFNIDLLSANNVRLTPIMQAYNLTQVI